MPAAAPLDAVALYLKTTLVNDLVSGRVYRPELDDDIIGVMPTECIVIRRAGGYGLFGNTHVPIGDPRLDILSYGQTYLDADGIAAEIVNALKALRGGVFTSPDSGIRTRLYWARIEAGPMPVTDPETDWPCAVVSAQVAHLELAVA